MWRRWPQSSGSGIARSKSHNTTSLPKELLNTHTTLSIEVQPRRLFRGPALPYLYIILPVFTEVKNITKSSISEASIPHTVSVPSVAGDRRAYPIPNSRSARYRHHIHPQTIVPTLLHQSNQIASEKKNKTDKRQETHALRAQKAIRHKSIPSLSSNYNNHHNHKTNQTPQLQSPPRDEGGQER